MTRPRLLDLFSGAGGCAMGYHRAGFEVTGVDLAPQPRYPFAFVQADALEYVAETGHEYDVIHASPPCQAYCSLRNGPTRYKPPRPAKVYPDLVGPTRDLLMASGKPWVIENVIGAPLRNAALVCGSAFGLDVRRHRLFEGSILLFGTQCRHHEQNRKGARFPTCFRSQADLRAGGKRRLSTVVQVYGHTAGKGLWPAGMGIDWMTSSDLTQAIPPAYTEFIGRQLIRCLKNTMKETL